MKSVGCSPTILLQVFNFIVQSCSNSLFLDNSSVWILSPPFFFNNVSFSVFKVCVLSNSLIIFWSCSSMYLFRGLAAFSTASATAFLIIDCSSDFSYLFVSFTIFGIVLWRIFCFIRVDSIKMCHVEGLTLCLENNFLVIVGFSSL